MRFSGAESKKKKDSLKKLTEKRSVAFEGGGGHETVAALCATAEAPPRFADAGCADRSGRHRRICRRRSLGYPRAGAKAVGTDEFADAGRFRPELSAPTQLPSGIYPAGQRRLSVGGAFQSFRLRSRRTRMRVPGGRQRRMALAARCFVACLHRPKRFADTPPALAENQSNSIGKELLRIGVFAFTLSTRCVATSLDAPEFLPSPNGTRLRTAGRVRLVLVETWCISCEFVHERMNSIANCARLAVSIRIIDARDEINDDR